jgi:hypothetical protein
MTTDIITELKKLIDDCIESNIPLLDEVYLDYINKINKHQKNEYMKNYIKDKVTLLCQCGGHYKKHQLHIHRKSKKHIKFLNDNNQTLNLN